MRAFVCVSHYFTSIMSTLYYKDDDEDVWTTEHNDDERESQDCSMGSEGPVSASASSSPLKRQKANSDVMIYHMI